MRWTVENIHEILLLAKRATARSIITNFACITPNGFLNRLKTVKSKQSSVAGLGRPNFSHVFGFHFLTSLRLKKFWRNEYENIILTVTRRLSSLARLLSVMRALWMAVSDGELAQKHVEKRTSRRAWTMYSVIYCVVTHPFPIMSSATRPELSTCSTRSMAARASSNTEFLDTLAVMTNEWKKYKFQLWTNR